MGLASGGGDTEGEGRIHQVCCKLDASDQVDGGKYCAATAL